MKKKGFTLIELLAVIVILAIIAVITVPMIMNVIEKAKLGALEDTVYGLSEAGELYYTKNMLDNNATDSLSFTPDESKTGMYSGTNKLTYKGTVPDTGSYVNVGLDGKIEVKVKTSNYCAIKSADSNKVTIFESDCTTLVSGETNADATVTELQSQVTALTVQNNILNNYYTYQNNALVPEMTSNTTCNEAVCGISSASSTYNSTYSSYNAFNSDINKKWDTLLVAAPHWIQYEFPTKVFVYRTKINWLVAISTSSNPGAFLKEFVIQGSNDGTNFENLTGTITIANQTLYTMDGDSFMSTQNIDKSYKYVRVYINSVYSSRGDAYLSRVQFYGKVDQ